MADAFGMDIARNNSKEGGALGVAILAGVGAGLYTSVAEACDALIAKRDLTVFDPEVNATYQRCLELYRRLYDSLKDDFKLLAGIC